MVHVYCNFCTHGNPDGSKFCNECGAQLNLAPCSRCDAVNTASARLCFQCGALLSSAFTEWSVPAGWSPASGGAAGSATSSMASVASVESPWVDHGTTSVALADAPEPLPAARPFAESGAIHASADDDAFVEAAPFVESAGDSDETSLAPSPGGRPDYPEHHSRRAHGILLAILVVAVAGGGYWLSVNPMRADDQRATTAPSTSAQEHVSSAPAAPAPTADTAVEVRDSPARDPVATTASTPPAPATPDASGAGEPEPSHENATSAPAASTPAPVEAQVPVTTPPAPSPVGTPPRTNARVVADAQRRAATTARTREQAERDAIATRRIIARDLADNPRTDLDRTAP